MKPIYSFRNFHHRKRGLSLCPFHVLDFLFLHHTRAKENTLCTFHEEKGVFSAPFTSEAKIPLAAYSSKGKEAPAAARSHGPGPEDHVTSQQQTAKPSPTTPFTLAIVRTVHVTHVQSYTSLITYQNFKKG